MWQWIWQGHGFLLNLFEIQAKDMHAQAQEDLSQR